MLAATVFHFGTLRIAEVKAATRCRRFSGTPPHTRADGETLNSCLNEEDSLGCRTPTVEEAERRLGGIPDGIDVDFYRGDGDSWPDSIAEVEFYVLPYMKGEEVLDRVAEMKRLKVIQTLTAGVENFLPYVPDGVILCNAAGVHDASTAELAVALALASGRHLDHFARNQPPASGTSSSAAHWPTSGC